MSSKKDKFVAKVIDSIDPDWADLLITDELKEILSAISTDNITPSAENIFSFTRLTPLKSVRIVIVGQDPYPKAGDAHGLAFSCLTHIPASLRNIYKCLVKSKLIEDLPDTGNLEYWSKQGVLLINRSLTTVIGKSNAHTHYWHDYTENILIELSKKKKMIFMLWGNDAQRIADDLADESVVYTYTHPSPLAQTKQSFSDCPHFIQANKLLISLGFKAIDWNVEPPKTIVEKAIGFGPGTLVVFTDGSCYPNKICAQSVAGYAAVFAMGTKKDVILYGNIENRPHFASNQRAEGIAMLKVFEFLKECIDEWDELIIISDSEFWIKMFEQYMPAWALHDKFEEKKNADLTVKMWNTYSELLDAEKSIKFRHVRSHDKDGWSNADADSYEYFCYVNNNYVDELCSYARTELKPGQHVVDTVDYDG